MSLSVSVRIPAGQHFTPAQWQAAIVEGGFDLVLDTNFDPVTFSGFLPAKYDGEDSGFEYFREPGSNGGEAAVSMVWHSDAREGICANIAAACLSSTTGGILVDCDGQDYAPEQAIGYALEWVSIAESPVPPRIVIRC
jgi:hypothetical protein